MTVAGSVGLLDREELRLELGDPALVLGRECCVGRACDRQRGLRERLLELGEAVFELDNPSASRKER